MAGRLTITRLLGPDGAGIAAAMQAGQRFLATHPAEELLGRLGRRVLDVPACQPIAKSALQDSYGGDQTGPSDDFLVGRGLFYLSEQRRLFLDCTSGHYQMLWGYQHPQLCAAITVALRAGVVWDNHSNIPQGPLKQLAQRLVRLACGPEDPNPLDTVLLGVCTGSVACAAALKIQLQVFRRRVNATTTPVILALNGNYHGTDMAPQFLRGMWPGLVKGFRLITLEPNQPEALEQAFRRHAGRVAGFWAEPIMMNREALAVDPLYLQLARRWCNETGALFCLDEIQTGFWRPEVFECRALGLRPDLLVVGKGMTAGFHPLSAVLFNHRHDVLAQYDAISTNGSAALPAWVALCSLELLDQQAARIRAVRQRLESGFQSLVREFPERLQAAQGRGHLLGLKFVRVEDALEFQRRLLAAGLWTRVHAYHAGHRTLLTKLGLLADTAVVDFVLRKFRQLLRTTRPRKG